MTKVVQDRRLPTTVPVSVYEPVAGPWTQDNTWGISKEFAWPATVGYKIPVLQKGDFPGPHRRRAVVLTRQIVPFVAGGPTFNSDVYAQITYGVGGASETLLADWVNGSVLLIPAGSLTIQAVSYRPDPNAAYSVPAPAQRLKLGAMFGSTGEGTAVGSFSQGFALAGSGGNQVGSIPRQAREVSLCLPGLTGAPVVEFWFQDAAGNIVGTWNASLAGDFQVFRGTVRIPIPGNAYSWALLNNNAAIQRVSLRWGLNV